MSNYSFTNIAFQIDSTNKLIIESIKNGNSKLGEIPLVKLIDPTVDVNEVIASVNNYFSWDEIGFNNGLYKPFINEINSKVIAIRNSMPEKAVEDFFNLKSQIDELVAAGGITEKDAVRVITNKYEGMTITYKNGSKRNLKSYLELVYRSQTFGAARQRSEEVAKDLGLNVYKLSTHSNPRQSCNVIQSTPERLFTFESNVSSFLGHTVIPASLADYGKASGLGGANCTHFWVGVQNFGDLKRKVPGADQFSNIKPNTKMNSDLNKNFNSFLNSKTKLDNKLKNNNINRSEYNKQIRENNNKYINKNNKTIDKYTNKEGG